MRIQYGLVVAGMMVVGGIASAQSAPAPAQASPLLMEQQRLATRFRPLMQRAVAPTAMAEDRADLVRFLHTRILPYLASEGAVVYPLVDTLAGGNGYATAAAVLDQAGIARMVDGLAAQARSGDRTAFVSQTYALAGALEAHFARDQALAQPILEGQLSDAELQTVLARIEEQRPRSASARQEFHGGR